MQNAIALFFTGAIAGVAGTLYWPTIKAWFSNEEAAIAAVVKAKI